MPSTDSLASPATEAARGRRPGSWRAGIAAVGIVVAILAPAGRASADVTFNQHLLELVNRDRAAAGLQPVVADPTLGATAEDAPYNGCGFTVNGRAKDMGQRNYFSHTILGCTTQSVFNILAATGLVFSGAGENIAWMSGTTDPLVAAENLHSQMMNSSGHRANVLNPSWTRVGIGSWRTAAGQSWSGGGFALTNVFIGVELFAGGAVDSSPPGRYTPLTPARILDTRDGTGGLPAGAVPAGGTIDVQVAGRGGIPTADVAAVALTVTITQPSAAGYLSVFPSGTARPLASNMNFVPAQTVSNLVVVKVGPNGKISMYNPNGTTHVVADVAGWYSSAGTGNAGRFDPVAPSRILDTRTGSGGVRLGPDGSLDLQVTGRGGVPASGAEAAVLNVTATGTTAASFLTVYPTGEARPWASNLTFAAGETVASRTIVKLGAGGKVTVYNMAGGADVIVDVAGWFTDSTAGGSLGVLSPLDPARILDTRDGTGGVAGALSPFAVTDVQVTGRGGVPASGVRAVILNATVTQPAAAGYLTVYPSGTATPLASDVNFAAGETRSNLVVVQVGANGKVGIVAATGTHVVFDVAGWIS